MSDSTGREQGSSKINLVESPGMGIATSGVDIHPMGLIRGFTVLERDLNDLEYASGNENVTLAFFCSAGGAAISCGVAWAAVSSAGALASAVLSGSTIALTLVAALCGCLWWRARKKRVSLLAAIKSAAPDPQRYQLVHVPPRL